MRPRVLPWAVTALFLLALDVAFTAGERLPGLDPAWPPPPPLDHCDENRYGVFSVRFMGPAEKQCKNQCLMTGTWSTEGWMNGYPGATLLPGNNTAWIDPKHDITVPLRIDFRCTPRTDWASQEPLKCRVAPKSLWLKVPPYLPPDCVELIPAGSVTVTVGPYYTGITGIKSVDRALGFTCRFLLFLISLYCFRFFAALMMRIAA